MTEEFLGSPVTLGLRHVIALSGFFSLFLIYLITCFTLLVLWLLKHGLHLIRVRFVREEKVASIGTYTAFTPSIAFTSILV